MSSLDLAAYRSAGSGFYRDAVKIILHPGEFYEAMPALKHKREAAVFLFVCAVLYSAAAALFAYENHIFYFFMFLANGLFVSIATAAALCLILFVTGGGKAGYATTVYIVAYAGVALLFAWIPGMAPFAEIYRYYLIGLGLVKAGKMGTGRTIAMLLATIALLWLVLYVAQILTGIA